MTTNRRDFLSMSAFLGLQGALLSQPSYGMYGANDEHRNADEIDPYLHSMHAPVREEVACELVTIEGKIPAEIQGVYFRNGPNPPHKSNPHHWFDGDGMIHRIEISNQKVTYRNRYVQTQGWSIEKNWGKVFPGLHEASQLSYAARVALSAILLKNPVKDTSNTDLIYFNDQIISLWWLAGRPYALDPKTLAPQGVANFKGYQGNMGAHARIDPQTGELFFLDFSKLRPWVRVIAITPTGELNWMREFSLPAPRIYHDILITENFVALLDFPVGIQPRLGAGIALDRNYPARVILVPRDGTSPELVFETEPCYVLHGLNAYEENNKVFVSVLKYDDPFGLRSELRGATVPYVGQLKVQTKPCLWTLDLDKRSLHETILDDENTEFPRINDDFLGTKSRFSYHPRLARNEVVHFNGLIKYDWQGHKKVTFSLPKNSFCEEFVFIKKRQPQSEDDGWVASIVHNLDARTNHFEIYDAQSMSPTPVARIHIPVRVPTGFHSKWVER